MSARRNTSYFRRGLEAGILLLLISVTARSTAQIPLPRFSSASGKPSDTQKAAESAKSSGTVSSPQGAEQTANPQPIPLPDVAMSSQQLLQTLRDTSATLPAPDQLAAMNTAITERGWELEAKRQELDSLLAGAPSSIELREQENYWRGVTLGSGWRKQLLDWAKSAQSAIDQLNRLEPQWSATLEANQNQSAELGPVIELIRENLAAIGKLRAQATDELQLIVKMQIAMSAQDQFASDVLARLLRAQENFQTHLLERDSLPLWQIAGRRNGGNESALFDPVKTRWIAISAFLSKRRAALALVLVVLAISLSLAYRVHDLTRNAQPSNQLQAEALFLVHRWVAIGVLPPLLLSYMLAPAAPLPFIGLAILFSFFPILRLLAPLLGERHRLILYCLAIFFAFNAANSWLSLSPTFKRELSFVINAALFPFVAFLLWPSRLRTTGTATFTNRILILASRLAVLALGLSLAANLFGYLKLAQLIGLACMYGAFIGISLYTGVRVFRSLLLAGLNLPQSDRLAVVRLHRTVLLRWVPRLLAGVAVIVWLTATLDLFRVRDQVTAAVKGMLNFRIAGAASEVTLGSIFGFFLMLALGYVIASAIRFLLREEVLNRFHLARGLPDLIASTIYYLLLLLVFLIAVNAGDIELNKFTLLTGALGVGFGFGMQNIINNFVSGLILQFERPIHINDVLEVDGYTGKVTRIGVRSSTLQTFQGAEVIIPNANFISGKVINWTLSESKRRAELPVGVAYGTDPDVVLKFLLDAANKHQDVLTDPPPAAYFKGFGESSLDFELHFWVMQDSNWVRVRSDIALIVMKSLEDAGIEIPFPQRDLHLRSVEGAASVQPQSGSSLVYGDDTKSVGIRKKTVTTDGD